jgi:hypothetical protein
MSAEQNVATIKEVYEAFGTGYVETILDKVTDDVDWAADAASDAAPWYGERRDKEAVAGFFQGIAESTEVREFTPLGFAATDNEVMTFIQYRMSPKGGGGEVSMHLHHYFRFRDGKIEYYRGSEDTAQTEAALSS